jgi:hypothetical protein
MMTRDCERIIAETIASRIGILQQVISGDCHPETPAVRTFLEMDVVRFQAMI